MPVATRTDYETVMISWGYTHGLTDGQWALLSTYEKPRYEVKKILKKMGFQDEKIIEKEPYGSYKCMGCIRHTMIDPDGYCRSCRG